MEPEMEDITVYDHPVPVSSYSDIPVKTIRKVNRSVLENYSRTGLIPIGPITQNPSNSNGNNTILTDYMDLIGDRYLDFLGESYVQYSHPWGGIGEITPLDAHVQKIYESVTFSSANTYGASYCEPQRVASNDPKNATIIYQSKGKGDKDSYEVQNPGFQGSGGVTLGSGTDVTEYTWLDMNGDGLPDKVTKDGCVALNLGYQFLPFEDWNHEFIREGSSENDAMSASVNLAKSRLPGGIAIGKAENTSHKKFMEFNGDEPTAQLT